VNADIPVIVIGAICTVQTGAVLWVVLKVADRLRLAAPPKQQASGAADQTASVPAPVPLGRTA
jgi:hypothetical protein